jgi:hypothetical protein
VTESRVCTSCQGQVLKSSDCYDPPLDPGIVLAVTVLVEAGVETFESCDGGPGHAYPRPTVRFHGHKDEGFRALAIVLRAGMQVSALRRFWDVVDGEPSGPHWELEFVSAAQ